MNRVKMVAGLLVLALSVGVILAQEEKKEEKKAGLPEIKVPVTKEAPKIDGTLDDAAWKQAATYTDFKTPDGKASKAKTKLYIMQDDKTVYIAVECFDTEKALKGLVADIKDHDGEVWNDDDVELFIDPTNKRDLYYHVIINSKGVTFDGTQKGEGGLEKDESWNPKYQSAAKVGKESWVAEFAFPVSMFNATKEFDSTWAFNVLRGQVGGDSNYLSPVGEEGGAHQPAKFAKLTGMTAKPGVAASAPATESKPAETKKD